jgi:DNA mismatch endonuclease (patch repair protein)
MRPRLRKKGKLTKSEQMARVRNKNTKPETLLRKALWAQGLRYRLRPKLPGTPDLVFVIPKVAVFVDGCFWHGCPTHYTQPVKNAEFWSKKLEVNLTRDRRADEELEVLGWTVVRVWGHELKENPQAAAMRVGNIVRAVTHRRERSEVTPST